jgi:hypothetical protein
MAVQQVKCLSAVRGPIRRCRVEGCRQIGHNSTTHGPRPDCPDCKKRKVQARGVCKPCYTRRRKLGKAPPLPARTRCSICDRPGHNARSCALRELEAAA